MTLSPCQNAPPQDKGERNGSGSTEVAAQAPLPPDEHKAVRWEGGDRRKTSFAANKLSTEAKKDDVVANVGVPHEEKVDVVHPLQQTVLIRGRANFFYLPNAMEGGKVNVSPCVNQTCHQPVIYLLI